MDSSLIIKKRDDYTFRAFQLLAAGIGVPKRRVEIGARLMLADAISFLVATLKWPMFSSYAVGTKRLAEWTINVSITH